MQFALSHSYMKQSVHLGFLTGAAGMALLCGTSSAALNLVRLGIIQPLGSSYETRLASNGTAATGWVDTITGQQGYHWDASSGMKPVGVLSQQTVGSLGYGISGDGSVAVGSSYTDNGMTAYRWTAAGGIVSLGDLAGGKVESAAYAASGDGSVIVGYGTTASSMRAFKWTSSTGMTALAMLSGENYSKAYAVSDDGKTIVGVTGHGLGAQSELQAIMWGPSGILGLGDLPGGSVWTEALAVNSGGTAVAGWGISLYGGEAFRWTAATGMTGLGDLPGGGYDSKALAISGDGGTVVGYGTTASGKEAFVWDEEHGMRTLRSILEAQGMDVTGWTFFEASGISTDGNVIAGTAKTPQGNWESFLVSGFNSIPEPSGAAMALGALAAMAMGRTRGSAKPPSGCC